MGDLPELARRQHFRLRGDKPLAELPMTFSTPESVSPWTLKRV